MNRVKIATELVNLARELAASDETNPKYMFQTIHDKLVIGIATGRIDAKKLAVQEMVSRGLDKRGK